MCLTCGTTDNLAVAVDAPRFDRRFVTSGMSSRTAGC